MFRLDGKIAAVTGGASGIGKAVANVFLKQGATVHVLDINASTDQVNVMTNNSKIVFHACDITNLNEVKNVFSKIHGLNILINNAGIAHIGNAETTTPEDFERVFAVNVKGVYNCLQAALPIMKQNDGGVIVNMCSVAALVGLTDRFAYSMSKGAIYSMTMSVAKDFFTL